MDRGLDHQVGAAQGLGARALSQETRTDPRIVALQLYDRREVGSHAVN